MGTKNAWHSNGQLASIRYFKDGKPSGQYKEWRSTGQLYTTYKYDKNGRKTGIGKVWYQNEKLKQKIKV